MDLALWDLLGKLRKQPVYALLGGKTKVSILYYYTVEPPTKDTLRQEKEWTSFDVLNEDLPIELFSTSEWTPLYNGMAGPNVSVKDPKFSFPVAFLDLREEDNLSIVDKMAGPNVSFIQRVHCT